jgi:hypothetical protein
MNSNKTHKEDDMTNTDSKKTERAPMNSLRKTSLVAGVFYLLTFVSIPTLGLYGSVRGPNYILGPGPDTPVLLGAILEMIVALAGMGTALTLLPGTKEAERGARTGLCRQPCPRTLRPACDAICFEELFFYADDFKF